MCLAVPALICEMLGNGQARVEVGGVRKQVLIELVPEARLGDYVIIHVGHAIGVLDTEEALRTLELFRELEAFDRESRP